MSLIAAILLSISANLDTLTVAISYGIKKVKLSFLSLSLITFITTGGTFISMYFGLKISEFISADSAAFIGALMLIFIGIYMIFDYFKNYKYYTDNSYIDNNNKSDDLTLKESITLSLALTINNLGIGIAASIAGISIFLNTLCTFVITILSLILGLSIGNSYLSNIFGKYGGLVSGIIIVLLGLYECLF